MKLVFAAHQVGHKVTGTADAAATPSSAKGQWLLMGAGISLYLLLFGPHR